MNIFSYLNNSKWFPYYIITPLPYAIGTACQDISIGILKANERNKILLIIVPKIFCKILKFDICNKYLFDYLIINEYPQNRINFIKYFISFILNIIFIIKRILALSLKKLLKIKLPGNYFFLDIGLNDDDSLYKKNNINLEISSYNFSFIKNNTIQLQKKEKILSEKIFQKLGLDKNQKFVCLHIRDHFYRNDFGKRNFRNSTLENYYELINFLTKNDLLVFRMGLVAEKRIDIKNKNIIDLPFLEINNDFFNLHLIKECNFFIGTQSGILDTAFLFRKDCLITNIVKIFNGHPNTLRSRSLFKIPYFKKNNKVLNLNEYLDLSFFYHHPNFLDNDLDYIENSSEDLYEAIKEYLALFNVKDDSKINLNQTQQLFNGYLLNRFSEMLHRNDESLVKYEKKIRLLKLLKSIKGSSFQFFLNKYFNEKKALNRF